jgi:hypothetical protein
MSNQTETVTFPLRNPGSYVTGWVGVFLFPSMSIISLIVVSVWGPGFDIPVGLFALVMGGVVYPLVNYRIYSHPRVDYVDGAIVVYTFFGKDVVPVDQVTALVGDRFLSLECVDGRSVALDPIDLAYLPIRPFVAKRVHAEQIELLKSVLKVP